jgi:hypothetical protein
MNLDEFLKLIEYLNWIKWILEKWKWNSRRLGQIRPIHLIQRIRQPTATARLKWRLGPPIPAQLTAETVKAGPRSQRASASAARGHRMCGWRNGTTGSGPLVARGGGDSGGLSKSEPWRMCRARREAAGLTDAARCWQGGRRRWHVGVPVVMSSRGGWRGPGVGSCSTGDEVWGRGVVQSRNGKGLGWSSPGEGNDGRWNLEIQWGRCEPDHRRWTTDQGRMVSFVRARNVKHW